MNKQTLTHIISIAILAVVTVVALLLLRKNIKIVVPHIEPPETVQHFNIETDAPESETASDTTEETDEQTYASEWILKETEPATVDYLEKIIFLGDRTIGRMTDYAIVELPHLTQQVWSCVDNISVARAIDTENFLSPITNELVSFQTALKARRPQYLILTFGSYFDDDEIATKESFINAYTQLIISLKTVSPNTQIIVQSILPVGRNCSIITANTIKERNGWLLEMCENNGIFYLDTWSALSDSDGNLLIQYYNPDNIAEANPDYCMNDVGYRKMVEYVRTHVHPTYVFE